MAIIFTDVSKCPICNDILGEERKYLILPNFISNVKDLLFEFSDCGVHLSCLSEHPLKDLIFFFKGELDKGMSSKKVRCNISGEFINNPRDIINFGLITSDEKEKLYEFNYLVFEKKNLNKWDRKDEFSQLISEFKNDGKWESISSFNYLDYLMKEVNCNSVN